MFALFARKVHFSARSQNEIRGETGIMKSLKSFRTQAPTDIADSIRYVHFQALKPDPKHTAQQWSVIISSRPLLHSRAGRCFLLGAIKSGRFDR